MFAGSLLEKYKPVKVLEVGVSAGATSLVLLEQLGKNGLDCQMYSLDLSDTYYRDTSKKTGFLIEEHRSIIRENVQHTLLLGKVIPQIIETIGDGIDFLILDTMHTLPGELIDFICCLPFLADGCVVLLHDIHYNLLFNETDMGFATNVLRTAVYAQQIPCEYPDESEKWWLYGFASKKIASGT